MPDHLKLGLPEVILVAARPETADVVIAFVRNLTELHTSAFPAIEAALRDGISYIAYPKAGQLDTDLNRDILARSAREFGIKPVRQISIDSVWSGLRFRLV